MNRFDIDKKIIADLKEVRSSEQLRELQKWAKKAKKEKVVDNTVTSFKKFYYSYTSRGSRRCYDKIHTVQFTSFVFLGMDIIIEKDNNKRFQFPETDFNSMRIWVDRNIKYGGTEYFPKQPITEYFGIDFEEEFEVHLNIKGYYLLIVEGRTKRYFLCNDTSNAKKLLRGRRLNSFDTCNRPVVKLSSENAIYVSDKIPTKEEFDFLPKAAQDSLIDELPF